MLSRWNRLVADKDIKRLFRKGKRFFGTGINLMLAPNGLNRSRFAFVVGTKVDKRAVVRNRLKRQMRETIRLRIDGLKTGVDAALIADKKLVGADFKSISDTVEGLLKKSGMSGK